MSDTKKVLIVEDDAALSNILQLKLTSEGFAVTNAYDGEAGLKAIQEGSFDVILLDLIMPKMNGFAVLEEVKKHNISTPIIVCSNLGQDEDIKKAKEFGVKDYYIKSEMSLNDVVELIKKYGGA